MNHDDHKPLDDRHEESEANDPQFDELLSAYVDGVLTGPELAKVELRLQQDEDAREWVADVQQLSRLMQSLPRQSLSPELRNRVLRQVAHEQPLNAGNRLTSPEPHSTSEPPDMIRRWLWPGLAIAAALLLMFLQSNQSEVKRRVAGRNEGQKMESEKEKGRSERREMMIGNKPAKKNLAHNLKDPSPVNEGGRLEIGLKTKPMPTSGKMTDSMRLAEDSATLTKGQAKVVPQIQSGSPPISQLDLKNDGGQLSQKATKPLSMGRFRYHGKSNSAPARNTPSDFVVQVTVSDPQLDRETFRTLLTEYGMKPLEGTRASPLPQKHSLESEKEGLERMAMVDRSTPVLPGEQVDKVVVETLPKQLHHLLHVYQENPALQGQYRIHEEKIQQQLAIAGNLQEKAPIPIRITFELRRKIPGKSIQKASSDRTTE